MRSLIQQKVDELQELAKMANEPNVQIVMLVLSASMNTMDDGLLAGKVQEFVKDVLLPRAMAGKEQQIASRN
jgi:hypothetical protein